MGDDALRSSERRWRETHAREDGRRYLAQLERAGEVVEALRVRVAIGALHAERLDLAAHVGHAPARAALGLAAAAALPGLDEWARKLFDWGHAACVRAAVAGARRVLAGWTAIGVGDPDADPRRAIETAEAWLACPCPRHYAEAEAFNLRKGLPGWAWQTVTSSHCAPRSCWHHVQALQEAAGVVGDEAVRAAVREALVGWAVPPVGGEAPLERAAAHGPPVPPPAPAPPRRRG